MRENSAGVVKFSFSPEIAKIANVGSGFGIDWRKWSVFASENPALEWGTACLIWCDFAASVAQKIKDEIPLMVDGMFFDFMNVVPFFEQNPVDTLLDDPAILVEQLKRRPHEFLFNP